MQRIVIAAVMLLTTATAAAAQAAPQTLYKDILRPNGQKRTEAAYQSDVDTCRQQTGGSVYLPDSAAMKTCMLDHGYRFVSQSGFDSGGSGGVVARSNWRIHISGGGGASCRTIQARTADVIEGAPAAGQPWLQDLVKQLRTRCLPQDHNPADYDPTNRFYVDPNNR